MFLLKAWQVNVLPYQILKSRRAAMCCGMLSVILHSGCYL
jgi:hypothetical protein